MTTPTTPKPCRPFAPPMAHKVRVDSVYTPSSATDIRKTFARLKREQLRAQQAAAADVAPAPAPALTAVPAARGGSAQAAAAAPGTSGAERPRRGPLMFPRLPTPADTRTLALFPVPKVAAR